VHAYGLRLQRRSLLGIGAAVQDGVAACADVPQHVLHGVGGGLRFAAFVEPLPLARAQGCRSVAPGRRRLPRLWPSVHHQLLKTQRVVHDSWSDAYTRSYGCACRVLTSRTEARCFARLASCLRGRFRSWRESISSCCRWRVSWSCERTNTRRSSFLTISHNTNGASGHMKTTNST